MEHLFDAMLLDLRDRVIEAGDPARVDWRNYAGVREGGAGHGLYYIAWRYGRRQHKTAKTSISLG